MRKVGVDLENGFANIKAVSNNSLSKLSSLEPLSYPSLCPSPLTYFQLVIYSYKIFNRDYLNYKIAIFTSTLRV